MVTKAKLVRAKDVLTRHLEDPKFRAEWERSALARAVAVAVVGYRTKHRITQTQLAKRLGVRQPHIARLELGEHTPSIEMLQRLSRALGLRFIVEVAPDRRGARKSALTFPPGVEVVEEVVSAGSRVRVATGA
jgi:ribosome-binding protein aMBF1 (putative translation factor)